MKLNPDTRIDTRRIARTIAPDISRLNDSAAQACALLKVLSHPGRLTLLCKLCERECCVSDLEAETGIRQPTLSQQLGVLREEGMVQTRRQGKQIYYSVVNHHAREILHVLYQLYCTNTTTREAHK